jgi:hypothetical protein
MHTMSALGPKLMYNGPFLDVCFRGQSGHISGDGQRPANSHNRTSYPLKILKKLFLRVVK